MRVVALEEHFAVPALVKRIDPAAVARRGFQPSKLAAGRADAFEQALEIGHHRLADMDAAGISVQVLSNTGPGPDIVPGPDGVHLAQATNDYLAAAAARYPDRFKGFAVLPMCDPDAAAVELERCVKQLGFVGANINGTTQDRFLDHPSYAVLLAAAAQLDVPLYLHPHVAPEAVRRAYFSDLPPGSATVLEGPGWGWHQETGLHILRLVLTGTLDQNPGLKLIIGHMGEMLPMMLARADDVFPLFAADVTHLNRSISQQILDQVWVTTSGMFTKPPFDAALSTFGIDRIMFSVDFPYGTNKNGRAFLDSLSLLPSDMSKLCHGNADRLLKLA